MARKSRATGLHAQGQQTTQLSTIVRALTNMDIEDETAFKPSLPARPFTVQEKIDYNNLELYAFVVKRYSEYNGRLQSLYTELEKQRSFKKQSLLRGISMLYLKVLGAYKQNEDHTQADIACKNADDIFEDVKNELVERVVQEVGNDLSLEDIEFGVLLVMVDAFMDCKILEPPIACS